MNRLFNDKEKQALYMHGSGKCADCGEDLPADWHADHVKPFSKGGKTEMSNAQPLCPRCNLKKGVKIGMRERQWQRTCFRNWVDNDKKHYLIAAAPGAGKTFIAGQMIKRRLDTDCKRVVVVVPTDRLKKQWPAALYKDYGLNLRPGCSLTAMEPDDYDGIVVTYQFVANNAAFLHYGCEQKPTVVIFDEIHHAAKERSWGEALSQAFGEAVKTIALSGTPFRTDNGAIPFVNTEPCVNDKGEPAERCVPDFNYSYAEGIRHNILKRVYFPYIEGNANWTFEGEEYSSLLSDDTADPQVKTQRLWTAFWIDRHSGISEWLSQTLEIANAKLDELRDNDDGRKDAAGIIFVQNQWVASCYETNKDVADLLGDKPVVVYSDKPDSADLIKAFTNSNARWIVSVKQISEGVDIPRLAIGVYAAMEKTDLIIRQRVGRVIRVDETNYPKFREAYMYMPDDTEIKKIVTEIEEERDHAIELLAEKPKPSDGENEYDPPDFTAGSTEDVAYGGVILGGTDYETTAIVQRVLDSTKGKLLGSFENLIMYEAIRKQVVESMPQEPLPCFPPEPVHEIRERMRKEEDALKKTLIGKLINGGIIRSSAMQDIFTKINSSLKKQTQALPDCTIKELEERQETIMGWLKNGYRDS